MNSRKLYSRALTDLKITKTKSSTTEEDLPILKKNEALRLIKALFKENADLFSIQELEDLAILVEIELWDREGNRQKE